MRKRVKTKVYIIALFCALLSLLTISPSALSSEQDDHKELITTKTFEYLKEKRVKGNDEKLKAIANSVYEESQKHDIDYRLILAVMKVESNFRHDAVSRKGARGLLQVKPSLAKHISKVSGIPVKNSKSLHEPEKNIQIGVNYLSRLIERFEDLYTALHAYNVGPRKVKSNSPDADEIPNNRFTRKVISEYQKIVEVLPDPCIE